MTRRTWLKKRSHPEVNFERLHHFDWTFSHHQASYLETATWFPETRIAGLGQGLMMTFLIFLLACGAAATTGVIFKPGEWYQSLNKPNFTPPNWAFPVAWTTIYLLLAWAGYRLTLLPGSEMLLALWAAQIALNTLWTPVFFGAHHLFASMVILALLWLVVAVMVVMALRLDVLTGFILLPYLLWLCVAAALNFSILRNNR
jgi:tryptophan-rich sensory protein